MTYHLTHFGLGLNPKGEGTGTPPATGRLILHVSGHMPITIALGMAGDEALNDHVQDQCGENIVKYTKNSQMS